MVMRAMASFSVGPTVSESILMVRRRAKEATGFRTPGLVSTYATRVCMLSSDGLRAPLRFPRAGYRGGESFRARHRRPAPWDRRNLPARRGNRSARFRRIHARNEWLESRRGER